MLGLEKLDLIYGLTFDFMVSLRIRKSVRVFLKKSKRSLCYFLGNPNRYSDSERNYSKSKIC